jgi:hypothetical protein
MNRNELSLDPRHLWVPPGLPKMIFEPTACSAQTMHIPYITINTISKLTEMRFIWHTSPRSSIGSAKMILSLWNVCPKPCTYIAPRLTLSPNGLKGSSTWPTPPRSSIRSAQNDFWAYCMLGINRALSCLETSTTSKETETSFHLTHIT